MLAGKLIHTRFGRQAIQENADLAIFRQKPSPRMMAGLICIAVSYLICWPLIGVLGFFSVYWGQPLWAVVGGPVIWTFSHFLCMFGVYLAGMDHASALLKWLVRIFLEKYASERLPEEIG